MKCSTELRVSTARSPLLHDDVLHGCVLLASDVEAGRLGRAAAIGVRILEACEVALDRFEGVESDLRRAARGRLLAASDLTQQGVLVDPLHPELLQALVQELVLAPRILQQRNALREACGVGRHGSAGQDLDGAMEPPLAVVQVHGAAGQIACEVVALATAAFGRRLRHQLQGLPASVAVLLVRADMGGASLVLAALQLAIAALQVIGLLHVADHLVVVERRPVPQKLGEPAGEKHGVRVNLHHPIVVAVAPQLDHATPDPVEHTRVQSCHPLAAKRHRQ
mmetsp:Transcript_6490/g.18076  ORF Transcript_6490/g.18076 Transcript_6490/m.18076 type:complete len:280 (+) Transcript_6490:131-970(+)